MEAGVDIERSERFNMNRSSTFLSNNFTKNELENSFAKQNPAKALSNLFSIKEAIIKTLPEQSVLLKDIEVFELKDGFSTDFMIDKFNFKIEASFKENFSLANVIRSEVKNG